MKNLSWSLNIVLLVAVAVLYYLHFSSPVGKSTVPTVSQASRDSVLSKASIAYVNIDSVLKKYDLYNEMKTTLEKKHSSLKATFDAKSTAFQKKAEKFQSDVQYGILSSKQAEEQQQLLGAEQQELVKMNDDFSQKLAEEEGMMMKQLYDSISSYLKRFNKGNYKFQYILGNSSNGGLLYADEKLEVTDTVVNGLNKIYQEKKGKK